MSEARTLLSTFKRIARAQGLSYRDIAAALSLSEASIKRLFSQHNISVDRLSELCKLIDWSLAELINEASAPPASTHHLNAAHEKELVSDPKLLLAAVCALNHWSFENIIGTYALSEAECLQRLLRLDKLGLIALRPGNRIRLRIARDFHWLPNGPIEQFFRREGRPEFLAAPFNGAHECAVFFHGMLTPPALAQFNAQLERLRLEFAALHADSVSAPFAERKGIGVLMAMRAWEPQAFLRLRRDETLKIETVPRRKRTTRAHIKKRKPE